MAEKFDVKMTDKYYMPDPSYKENSWVGDYTAAYERFLADPDGFWDAIAQELHWFEPYSKIKEWNFPHGRWFLGGKTNITFNCLDRHVLNGRRNKVALIWRGEEGADSLLPVAHGGIIRGSHKHPPESLHAFAQ